MNRDEINQLLTERVFGECWGYPIPPSNQICSKCDKEIYIAKHHKRRQDFFTNAGCMELWLKIQEMRWFEEFGNKYYLTPACGMTTAHQLEYFIHPDVLAPAVAEFLREREE